MLPFAAAVFILGDHLVAQILGDRWLAAAPAIEVLAFASVLGALNGPVRAMLHGVGRPAPSLWLGAATAALFVATVYPLTSRFGITGAAAAVLLSRLGMLPLQFAWVSLILHVGAGRLIGASLPGLAMSGVTALALLAAVSGLDPASLTDLALVVGLTLPVYLASIAALWRFFKAGPSRPMASIRTADVETAAYEARG